MAYFSEPNPPYPRPSLHLKRYMDYFQFGDRFLPGTKEAGTAKRWHFFRICHSIRVKWENDRQEARERESAENRSNQSKGTGTPKRPSETDARHSRRLGEQSGRQRQLSDGEKRAAAERVEIQEAQERLGVPEYNKHANTNDGKSRPKNFRGTRVKVRKRGR